MKTNENRQKILIVDDSAMNRDMLIDILEDDFDTLEACNGAEAMNIILEYGTRLDLILLDIVMPGMSGFDVLAMMNASKILEDVPVIMISAENQPANIEHAYEMGATDYISRPFNISVVRRRVINTLNLHAKQKQLRRMITNLVYEKEKNNSMMINILSHVVEFRNGESGLHVLHIASITDILLRYLVKKTDRYQLTQNDMALIKNASALHDIGKISISGSILNKPGRLTKEEFEIMKTHTIMGESLLKEIPLYQNEPLVKISRQVCRWHHERYDGRGYPDGLKGEEIPIAAQIVSVADVYDALTSERCYKKAFSHKKALEMILNHECGVFSDLLMECLQEAHEEIIRELGMQSNIQIQEKKLQEIVNEFTEFHQFEDVVNPLRLMMKEQEKARFYADTAEEIRFDYDSRTSIVIISKWGADYLGIENTIYNTVEKYSRNADAEHIRQLQALFWKATPESPEVQTEIRLQVQGQLMQGILFAKTLYSEGESQEYLGAVGKVIHLHPLDTCE